MLPTSEVASSFVDGFRFTGAQSPFGDPTLSSANIEMTRHVANIAKPSGVQPCDQIIVGKDRHTSLRGC